MPPKPLEIVVRCSGLVKRYRDVVAVAGLDLEVRVGECLGLLGPNGAGKTTTVEMIEGLTRPDEGSVELFGQRWGDGDDRALRARLGVLLQDVRYDDRLQVGETVRMFRSFFSRGRTPQEAIGLVDLEAKTRARVGKLSGGQRQRLALACAMVGAPDLLCLDEPTTGLDPTARRRLWDIVRGFQEEGGTTLITTHYMEEAATLCDRVAFMDAGRVVAQDTPDALIAALGADQIVELDVPAEAPRDADRAALEALAGVRGLRETPAGWVLVVDHVAAVLPAALRVLSVAPTALRTHRATLEDVFIARTGRGLTDG